MTHLNIMKTDEHDANDEHGENDATDETMKMMRHDRTFKNIMMKND